MKRQLDIFGDSKDLPKAKQTSADESPATSGEKSPKKRRRREVKKAPMVLSAFVDASTDVQSKGQVAGKSSPSVPKKAFVPPPIVSEAPPVSQKSTTAQTVGLAEKRQPRVHSVSELTEKIKNILEGNFPDIWVAGEITDLKNKNGNHLYFKLKDEKKNSLNIAIFNHRMRKISFDLDNGMEIICHGNLNVYGPGGYYSLIADYVEPKGLGALQIAFEQMKKKLDAEGLFARERKRTLPFLPRRVGVVTSPTGAAIQDIIKVLTRRLPSVEILLYPVKVQGEGAKEEIAEAVLHMGSRADIDVLIVGRGGGSMEDLWAFNEEVVARAIAASKVPTISAVGHEIDFTIADFVADMRAPTPSAAAEMAVPVLERLIADIKTRKDQMVFALGQRVARKRQDIERMAGRLKDPSRRFPDLMRSISHMDERLRNAIANSLENKQSLLVKFSSNLDHLSPLGVLSKGCPVATDAKGHTVRSAAQLKTGELLLVRFKDGSAETEVKRTMK